MRTESSKQNQWSVYEKLKHEHDNIELYKLQGLNKHFNLLMLIRNESK